MVLNIQEVSGMYDIMKLVTLILLIKTKDVTFEKKDIIPYCNISDQAVSNNLRRLCELGFISKEENYKLKKGRTTMYKINGDQIESICNSILM